MAVKCLNHNLVLYFDCVDVCGDDNCKLTCGLTFIESVNECPCYEFCPTGCENCDNEFCKCADPESNLDFIQCQERVINSF